MPSASKDPTVASITVAWNGSNLLPQHLKGLLEQSHLLDEIIVVDNASSDDTLCMLKQRFPQVTVIPVKSNVGMGGGLSAGLGYGLHKPFDWFWFFDQDSVAAPTALEELFNGLAMLSARSSRVGILASLPLDPKTGLEHFGLLWRDRFVSVPRERAREPVCFVDL